MQPLPTRNPTDQQVLTGPALWSIGDQLTVIRQPQLDVESFLLGIGLQYYKLDISQLPHQAWSFESHLYFQGNKIWLEQLKYYWKTFLEKGKGRAQVL